MANRQGKFQTPRTPVPPRRNDAGQRRRRRRGPNPLFIILVAVFCVALIAVAAILIHMGKARSDFRKLSEMVEENATATAAPVETTPPETQSTGPTTETTVPTEPEPTEPVMLAKYAPLYEQNHDLFGWLRIDGTGIDLPVVGIGGVTAEDMSALAGAGLSGIALSGSVLRAADPVGEMRRVMQIAKQVSDNYGRQNQN